MLPRLSCGGDEITRGTVSARVRTMYQRKGRSLVIGYTRTQI